MPHQAPPGSSGRVLSAQNSQWPNSRLASEKMGAGNFPLPISNKLFQKFGHVTG